MFINKVAIITGASRGIGLAIARKFHQEGATVVLCGRTLDALKHQEVEFGRERCLALQVDIRDSRNVHNAVAEAVARFGKIDFVINNAGISGVTSIDAEDTAQWVDIVTTNLIGSYYVTRSASPHIPDGGRIVMMSSVLGKFGVPGYTAYCSSKTALIGFTRALALELAPRKITVNALCPGWVDTDMAWDGMKTIAANAGISVEEFHRKAMAAVPLGKMVQPEEVAGLTAFLCSDAGKNITAQAISICGGSTYS
jgi:NAD(P)-dependent dehydrogenase (short-subunit alcohol dehydrogenase family)